MTIGLPPGDVTGFGAVPAGRGGSGPLLARLRAHVRSSGQRARSARLRRLSEAWAVLADARTVVEDGWLQEAWYGTRRLPGKPSADPVRAQAPAACLVGAVVHAARHHYPEGDHVDAAPALDALWDAWQESRGLDGSGVFGRAASPAVRAARVRDLTRWNDHPGRTHGEVLGLLDLAIGRAMEHAARIPAGASGSRNGMRTA
jgi:hypothetical protein